MNRKVFVTGMSGCIGSILYGNLKDKWQISGIDIQQNDSYPVTFLDISSENGLNTMLAGAEAVIHLAANANFMASWEQILKPNIMGTRNVFEAAYKAGVKKVIFASSNHVTGLYEQEDPYKQITSGNYQGLKPGDIPQIDHTFPVKPDSFYGVSKSFGEVIGRYYAEKHGMQVVCIRIGTVNRENRPLNTRQFATLFIHSDLVKTVDKCLETDDIKFEIFYGVSNNTWKFWDTSRMQHCLGWEPEENAELLR